MVVDNTDNSNQNNILSRLIRNLPKDFNQYQNKDQTFVIIAETRYLDDFTDEYLEYFGDNVQICDVPTYESLIALLASWFILDTNSGSAITHHGDIGSGEESFVLVLPGDSDEETSSRYKRRLPDFIAIVGFDSFINGGDDSSGSSSEIIRQLSVRKYLKNNEKETIVGGDIGTYKKASSVKPDHIVAKLGDQIIMNYIQNEAYAKLIAERLEKFHDKYIGKKVEFAQAFKDLESAILCDPNNPHL
ncbi:hypothetical protein H4219_005725 [Mycoemilia scoparia]|uniref:Uncharacterized protein n=1 Tax=Mycoemilia scoparia TaxID=417184 RepID=A0A9W8DNX0_9FUNG|nr:hypothetical protein H4219_005725 [Mycoemilia scoparia]